MLSTASASGGASLEVVATDGILLLFVPVAAGD